jgi:hypothetical protein
MKAACLLEVGSYFQWQTDVYYIHAIPDEGPIRVTRVAGLWLSESNPYLKEDMWITTNSNQIENFNEYCEVTPVKIQIVPIKI